MTPSRKIRLYAYFSSKGGVGKSTLSYVTARLAADVAGREAVLLDLDMWGSSLADGLRMVAPVVPTTEAGLMRFDAEPTGRYMTWDETLKARQQRAFGEVSDASLPPFLPYLNDAFYLKADRDRLTAPLAHLLWRDEGVDDAPVAFMPSSPLFDDLERVAAWLAEIEVHTAWAARVWWVILTLIAQRPGLTDIVCDLPPGFVGLPHVFRTLISTHARGEAQPDGFPRPDPDWDIEILPALVTTQDRQALVVAAEAFVRFRHESPGLTWIVNQLTTGRSALSAILERHFAPFFGDDPYKVDRVARAVDRLPALERIFRRADSAETIDLDTLRRLRGALRIEEGTP